MRKFKFLFKKIKRILHLINSVSKTFVVTMIINTLIMSFFPAASLLIMQNIINNIQNNISEIQNIMILMIVYVVIEFIISITTTIVELVSAKFNLDLNLYVNRIILNKANKLTLKDFENSDTYDMLQRAEENGIQAISTFITHIFSLIKQFVSIFIYISILFTFNIYIVIIISIIPILEFIITKNYVEKSYSIRISRTNEERKSWYYKYLLTKENFYKDIKINKLFSHFYDKYASLEKKFICQDYSILNKYKKNMLIVTILDDLVSGLIFIYIIYLGFIKIILLGNVLTYIRSLTEIKSLFRSILQSISELNKASLELSLLFTFLDYKPTYDYYSITNKIEIDCIKKIEFRNVSYKYKNNSDYCLNNLSFIIDNQNTNILIGENGSGKSTLIKILLGFYMDYEGDIFINEINLKNISLTSYQNNISCLFQDFVKFEETYYNNIAFGDIRNYEDSEKVELFSKNFLVNDIIYEKNDTLYSQIGYWFNNGSQISGGQWQKIALARTFFKDSDLYILDEPNSALDPFTEKKLFEEYLKYTDNKLSLIVLHRFKKIISDNTNIIILSKGEILDYGKHDDLFNRCNYYKDLYDNSE